MKKLFTFEAPTVVYIGICFIIIFLFAFGISNFNNDNGNANDIIEDNEPIEDNSTINTKFSRKNRKK